MASISDLIEQVCTNLENIKLTRPELGTASHADKFKQGRQELTKLLLPIRHVADQMRSPLASKLRQPLENLVSNMEHWANLEDQQYLGAASQISSTMQTAIADIEEARLPFVIAAIERAGLIDAPDVAISRLAEKLEAKLGALVDEAKPKVQNLLDEAATQKAEEIIGKARAAAQEQAAASAQEQFKTAATQCRKKAFLWAIPGLGMFCLLIWLAWYFLQHPPAVLQAAPTAADSPTSHYPIAIYHSALRLTILAAVSFALSFCVRALRSQLHLLEHNLHRQRLANSIGVLIESASTPAQRDLIVVRLAEAIAAFGPSGLLKGEDSPRASRMLVENLLQAGKES